MAGKVITDFIRMQLFRKGGAIANDKLFSLLLMH
jgi:hypothetical protein